MATKKQQPAYLTQPRQYNYSVLDDFLTAEPPAAEQPEESGMLRRVVGDTGVSLLKGAIAVPEAAVGLADLVTGGEAGRAAQEAGFRPAEARQILDDYYSPEQKAANRAVQEAEGITGKLGAAVTNPSTIVHSAVESVPLMLGGGVAARGLMKAGASAIPAAAAGEGIAAAGSTAEQVRQHTSDGTLTAEQAALAAGSGAATGLLGLVAGRVANKLGIGDIDTLIAGGTTTGAAQKMLVRKVLEGAVSEGVLEELPQSVQEQVAQNAALARPLDENVDYAAVMGLLTGAAMGGAAAPMVSSPGDAVREQKVPENGPLSRAVNAGIDDAASKADLNYSEAKASADLMRIEQQGQQDVKGLRDFSGRSADVVSRGTLPADSQAPAPAAPTEVSAEVVPTEPLFDRIITLQETLADPATMQALREKLGPEAVDNALYYVNAAGVANLPERTRAGMVELAERIVSRAQIQPIEPAQPAAQVAGPEAVPALGMAPRAPQIGLDTQPTGTIRVDAAGNAAPETRADAISSAQAQAEADSLGRGVPWGNEALPVEPAAVPALGYDQTPTGAIRVDGQGVAAPETRAQVIDTRNAQPQPADATLGQQARKASAVYGEPGPAPAAAPRALTYDTAPTGRMVAGQQGVQVETQADRINLEQARRPMPGDVLNPSGKPFKNKVAANLAQKRVGGGVVAVEGGWVVRPGATDGADAQGDGGLAVADAGRGDGTELLRDQQPGVDVDGSGAAVAQGSGGDAASGVRRGAGNDALTDEIRTASGGPFKTKVAANVAAKKNPGYAPAAVDGGFVLRRMTTDEQKRPAGTIPAAQAAPAQAAAPAGGDAARTAGTADAGAAQVQADGVSTDKPASKSKRPRMGESADAVWKAIKQANGGVVVEGRVLYPTLRVVAGDDYQLQANGKLGVVDKKAGGIGVRDATKAEVEEFHKDLERDAVQVVVLTSPGYGSGYRATRRVLQELHSPSGLSYEGKANKTAEPKFSRGAGHGMSKEAVQEAVGELTAKWENAPPVIVVEGMQDEALPKAIRDTDEAQRSQGAEGADPDAVFYQGRVYLFASQLGGKADVMRTLFHESLGHFGLRGTFGKEMSGILDRMATLRSADVKAKAKEYGYDYSIAQHRRMAAEEVLAEMAQSRPEIGWVRQAVAAVRAWLRRNVPGFDKLRLTDDEIISEFILPARRFVERGSEGVETQQGAGRAAGQDGEEDVAFSRGVPDSAAFKRWFGDSKVVDADGKPLVVYHGTTTDFSTFDAKRLGKNTGHPTSNLGFFFSAAPEVAQLFTESIDDSTWPMRPKARDGANLMPVYLSIKNPFVMDVETFRRIQAVPYGEDFEREQPEAAKRQHDWIAKNKERLVSQGYDGIHVKGDPKYAERMSGEEYAADAWVAFSPSQIKSATGNRGTFDPNSDNVMFSRPRPLDALRSSATTRQFAERVADAFRTSRSFNFWHRTVGTQFHKAKVNRFFKRVYDAGQDYLHDVSAFATDAAMRAQQILPQLNSWRDLDRKSLSAADSKAIAKPIFEGTLAEEVYTPAQLKQRFGLNDKQVELYREFRAAVDRSLDLMVATDVLRYLGDDAPKGAREMASAGDVDGVFQAVNDHLAKREDELGKTLRETVAEKYQRIEDLKFKGYAPLSRFGRYAVHIVKDGDTKFFSLYESQADANKAARELAADPEFKGASITNSVMSQEEFKLFKGLTPETLELFADVAGIEKNELVQEYLKNAVAGRSALKRLIHRKGTAGYSEDVSRVLAAFLTSNARAASGNLHFGELTRAVSQIPREMGDVKDEAVKLQQYIQNPSDEGQAIRGFLFTQFIGGSVASAAVNLTQPLTMTLPYLSQFGGPAKSAARVAAAMKQAMAPVRDADLKEALERAEKEGIVSPQEIHQLQGEASRSAGNHPWVRKAMFLWGGFFALTEQMNRRTTFIAAWNTAKAEGMADPFKFASDAVDETQGVYNRGNRPNWAREAVGGTLFTFKQFSIAYLEMFSRLPPREKVLMLAILMLTAGANGLPFADDIDDLVDALAQKLGYDFNTKQAKDRFLTSVLGKGGSDFVLRGFSALPGFPLDVAGRMSVGNLIPGTGALLKSSRGTNDLIELAGPAASFGKQISEAGGQLLEGDIGKAAKSMAPVALQNVSKALDMAQTGMYRDTKGRRVLDVNAFDAMVKGIGFQPAEVARASRERQENQQQINLAKTVESEIAAAWAQGVFEKDQDRIAEARERLRLWNERNPESRIKITMPQVLRRVREMKSTAAERQQRSAPKEMRGSLQ
jgi:hypothetical protein